MKLTPIQNFVRNNYAGGDMAHLDSPDKIKNCGDSLYEFCIAEAQDAGESYADFVGMLETAINQLRSLQADVEEMICPM